MLAHELTGHAPLGVDLVRGVFKLLMLNGLPVFGLSPIPAFSIRVEASISSKSRTKAFSSELLFVAVWRLIAGFLVVMLFCEKAQIVEWASNTVSISSNERPAAFG